MKQFKRILVGLDGKDTDAIILEHIAKIKDSLDIQKIYFVHITKDLDLFDNSELLYAEHIAPVDENIRKLIISDLEMSFKKLDDLDYEIIVKDGNPGEEIQKLIKIKQIDLLVLGRKQRPGITYFSRQLASQTPCSVLFVPKSGHKQYKRILVPMDFSSNSKQAIEMALHYKKANEDTVIMPVHFYNVPPGYSKLGKSFNEYSKIMRKNTESQLRNIVPEELIANCVAILDKQENIAKMIFNYSLRKGADLIIIGSRGRTKIASFLFGSVAAKLVELSYHLPILIDKKQRMNMGAMKALMKI